MRNAVGEDGERVRTSQIGPRERVVENASLVGLSRQVALRRELDVISNNIANMNTTGFKADSMLFAEFLMPKARDDSFMRPDRPLSFVEDRATVSNFAGGEIQTTGDPTDVAIDGEGFFEVESDKGVRYTRNGSFKVDATGMLVTSEGYRVMTTNGPLQLAPNETGFTVDQDGQVATSEGTRGKLRVVRFANLAGVKKETSTTFSAAATPTDVTSATRLIQGAVEKSNVQGIAEMSRLVEVTRSYQDLSSLLERQDELRRTSIERLADVPA